MGFISNTNELLYLLGRTYPMNCPYLLGRMYRYAQTAAERGIKAHPEMQEQPLIREVTEWLVGRSSSQVLGELLTSQGWSLR